MPAQFNRSTMPNNPVEHEIEIILLGEIICSFKQHYFQTDIQTLPVYTVF